jgi:hypothetical protein
VAGRPGGDAEAKREHPLVVLNKVTLPVAAETTCRCLYTLLLNYIL